MRESVIYQDILQEGIEQKAPEIARNMINEGVAIALIISLTGLTVQQVQQLQAQINHN